MIIFETKVLDIGENAEDFKVDDTVVTYYSNVPHDLVDYAYIIEKGKINGLISVGDLLKIDAEEFKITAVGLIAQSNLEELGHACFKFNGSNNEYLPGSINLEKKPIPVIKIGTEIKIISLKKNYTLKKEVFKDDNTTKLLEKQLTVSDSYADFKVRHKDKLSDKTFLVRTLRNFIINSKYDMNTICKRAKLAKSYVYQILNGNRVPSRDKIICLSIALDLSLKETNSMLRYSERGQLYAKKARDAVIMHSILHNMSLDETNKILSENDYEVLH